MRQFAIEFPVVEGYAFSLRRNAITADIESMERLHLQPEHLPTAVFVKPRVGYETGTISMSGPGQFAEQDRQEFYESTHLQTIQFQIATEIVGRLMSGVVGSGNGKGGSKIRYVSRHQLFPQVYRLVERFVRQKVDFRSVDARELGLRRYFEQVVERLMERIEPDEAEGESPLLPILNRYEPRGSTADVNFKTTKPTFSTIHSHLNSVVADTASWEQSAAFRLEQAAMHGLIECYTKNDHLGFTIPYEFYGVSHVYEPDFLIRLQAGHTLILEVKGWQGPQAEAKHESARRWVGAINNWGEMGRWDFHVNRDPQTLLGELGGY